MASFRHHDHRSARRGGFTLVEVLVVMVIMAIGAVIAVDAVAQTEWTLRAERAGREAIVALRYARALSMSTGTSCKVSFDTVNKTIQVLDANGNLVNQTLSNYLVSGQPKYQISLVSQAELAGTTMAASVNNDSTNPYTCTYNALGATTNYGTVTFTFGKFQRIVNIPAVGEPN